ncbi:unnamed protein product [Paramecium primaurelia]|uniref:SAM-dependent MTase RsmB/NOP-type domain-containing protein n=1 Tax=Paramecium primaurelia TaxID=5886 RepID=A0A8S1QGK2_PARPR|nr:unnamed protein product [Paramecium primaurelia]
MKRMIKQRLFHAYIIFMMIALIGGSRRVDIVQFVKMSQKYEYLTYLQFIQCFNKLFNIYKTQNIHTFQISPKIQFIFQYMGKHRNKNQSKYENAPQKKVKTNHWDQDNQQICVVQFENPIFRRFYEIQLPEISPEEFKIFWQSLSLPLPVTFRINPSQYKYESLIERLQDGSLIKDMVNEEEIVEPIREIKWYPNHLVWESKVPKKSLRKSAALTKLHQFIQKCNSTGLLTRQELVSMLPPLLLDPQPTDYVLDMCAAPGSKTCQLLEIVNKGLIVANDVDPKRAYMLSHQLSRMPTAQVMITNYAAQFYPTLYINGQRLQFDKVLCDVPCTGDGAARKLPTRWVKWSARDGNVIHPLQLSILMRALQLCKIGGYVMYSTCSLNPIEDEAVVAEVFRRAGFDAFELVDLNTLQGFKTRKGIKDWKVIITDDFLTQKYLQRETNPDQDEKSFLETVNEDDLVYEVNNVNQKLNIKKLFSKFSRKQEGQMINALKTLKPSLWPDTEEFMNKIAIEKTMRVLPHDQDTGGFYLALFKKKQAVIWKKPIYQESIIAQQQPILTEQQQQQQQIEIEQIVDKPLSENLQLQPEQVLQQNQQEQQHKEILQQEDNQQEQFIQDIDINQDHLKDILKQSNEQDDKQQNDKNKAALLEPYTPINDYDWKVICDYYGISGFPQAQVLGTGQSLDIIMQVNKKFRYVSEDVKNILFDSKNQNLKLINIGQKLFERGKESFGGQVTPFKITQEGLPYIFKYLTKRVVECNKDQFMEILQKRNIRMGDFAHEELKQQFEQLIQGCFVLFYKETPEISEAIVCQYYKQSVNLMCSTENIENILIRHRLM